MPLPVLINCIQNGPDRGLFHSAELLQHICVLGKVYQRLDLCSSFKRVFLLLVFLPESFPFLNELLNRLEFLLDVLVCRGVVNLAEEVLEFVLEGCERACLQDIELVYEFLHAFFDALGCAETGRETVHPVLLLLRVVLAHFLPALRLQFLLSTLNHFQQFFPQLLLNVLLVTFPLI